MGCDIHGVVETFFALKEWRRWSTCATVRIERDYILFGALAGVRQEGIEHIPPRGIPSDISATSKSEIGYWVSDKEQLHGGQMGGPIGPEAAKDFLDSGSIRIDEEWITGPDYHSFSWLAADELEHALRICKAQQPHPWYNGPAENIYGVLGMMRAIEERGVQTRFVFWFDN